MVRIDFDEFSDSATTTTTTTTTPLSSAVVVPSPPPPLAPQNQPSSPPLLPPQPERQLFDMDDASYPSLNSTEASSTASSIFSEVVAHDATSSEAVVGTNHSRLVDLDEAIPPSPPPLLTPQRQLCDLDDASYSSAEPDAAAATNSLLTRLWDGLEDDAYSSATVSVNNSTKLVSTVQSITANHANSFQTVAMDVSQVPMVHNSDATKSFVMTRVDLDEPALGNNDHASGGESPRTKTTETARYPTKSAHKIRPEQAEQQRLHISRSRRLGRTVACLFSVLFFALFAVVLRFVLRSKDHGDSTISQSENYCRLCPVGFELATPDALFDLPTSSSAVKGLKCREVLEKAQAGEYNTGLYCALIQTEATAVCPCKETPPKRDPKRGKPTASPAPTPSPTTSLQPSAFPTMEEFYVPPNPVPENRPRWYFNYDLSDNKYGPNGWKSINMDGSYYEEFGANGFGTWDNHLIDHVSDPTDNRCGVAGKQTPVDLIKTTGEGAECTAAHQIRTRPGSLPLIDSGIKKLIEPNKLRIDLYRRGCKDIAEDGTGSDACRPRPPIADFPNYSSTVTHHSDLLHLDIKVPGEHSVRGETFDAEIQMMHIHLDASRIGYVGVPIRATLDGYNEKYQALLDQFQFVYDNHKAECAAKQRRRGLRSSAPKGFMGNTEQEQSFYSDDPAFKRRMQQIWSSKLPFDPHGDFLETVFFYRYNGSSPDPPCFPVTWFVLEKPIHIDFQQLKQTKQLLFTHVNANCEKTSVHNADQSVVRPIQPLGKVDNEKREIMSCMPGDFTPDDQHQ